MIGPDGNGQSPFRWIADLKQHPVAAFLLTLVWAAVLAVGALLGHMLAKPVQQCLEQSERLAADRIRDDSGCVVRYERTFMRPLLPG